MLCTRGSSGRRSSVAWKQSAVSPGAPCLIKAVLRLNRTLPWRGSSRAVRLQSAAASLIRPMETGPLPCRSMPYRNPAEPQEPCGGPVPLPASGQDRSEPRQDYFRSRPIAGWWSTRPGRARRPHPAGRPSARCWISLCVHTQSTSQSD